MTKIIENLAHSLLRRVCQGFQLRQLNALTCMLPFVYKHDVYTLGKGQE